MTIINNTPDDEIILNITANEKPTHFWEQVIARITRVGILNFWHPIHNYDQFSITHQIDEADFLFEDEDELVGNWETTTIFDFGWRCQC
jgi:hypothetical protein